MRQWRVGTLTVGLTLIGFGILFFVGQLKGISTVGIVNKWWPVILILFGVDTLICTALSKRGETRLTFDRLSIFFMIVVLILAGSNMNGKPFLNNVNLHIDGQNIFRNYKYETKFNKKIAVTAEGVKELYVSNSMGKIDVSKGTGENIEVEANITIRNNEEAYAKTVIDNAVEVTKGSETRISTAKYPEDDKIKSIAIDYTIRVPQGIKVDIENSFGDIKAVDISSDVHIKNANGKTTAGSIGGSLTVNNSFGDIEAAGIKGNADITDSNGRISVKNTDGSVDVKNSFGEIEIQKTGGNVKAAGSNGRIYIEDPAGDVYAHNSFGEISVKNASKSLDLESSNGLIKLETSKIIENDVSIKNSFGGIKLDFPKGQTCDLKASTSFGKIHSNMNLNINEEVSKQSVNQQIGDGKIEFDIRTSNGNIDINGN